ncbi:MAG: hypothetical protein K0S58_1033 [Nitrospira sp.]|jgi:hypothetical protein|nr:hypothetical protein [Nitrospira sp.]
MNTENTDGFSSIPSVPTGQHLTWTIDTPTKPGWYWSQMRAGRPHVIELLSDFDSGRLTVAQTGAYVVDLEAENHRWAGPLLQPEGGMMWANYQPPQAANGREHLEY